MAAQFSVSVSFVEKLLQRQRTSGSLAPWPLCGGPASCLDASSRADLMGLPAPAARCHPGRITGVAGCAKRTRREPGDGWAGPCRLWTGGKKKSVHAAERDPERVRDLRAAFLEALQTEDVTCFKFVNETSTNLTYCRPIARAEGGQ